MARPSKRMDLKLLKTGRKHFIKNGISGLSVRQIAKEANVNLGMFNYHFGSKENFVRQLLQSEYEKFFNALNSEFEKEASKAGSKDKFHRLIVVFVNFVLKERQFVATLLRDLLSGNKIVAKFIRQNAPRHIGLLIQAAAEGQAKGELRQEYPVEQVLILCLSVLGPPVLLSESLRRMKIASSKSDLFHHLASKEVLMLRTEMLMQGLRP